MARGTPALPGCRSRPETACAARRQRRTRRLDRRRCGLRWPLPQTQRTLPEHGNTDQEGRDAWGLSASGTRDIRRDVTVATDMRSDSIAIGLHMPINRRLHRTLTAKLLALRSRSLSFSTHVGQVTTMHWAMLPMSLLTFVPAYFGTAHASVYQDTFLSVILRT
jgi:hypothetical protein